MFGKLKEPKWGPESHTHKWRGSRLYRYSRKRGLNSVLEGGGGGLWVCMSIMFVCTPVGLRAVAWGLREARRTAAPFSLWLTWIQDPSSGENQNPSPDHHSVYVYRWGAHAFCIFPSPPCNPQVQRNRNHPNRSSFSTCQRASVWEDASKVPHAALCSSFDCSFTQELEDGGWRIEVGECIHLPILNHMAALQNSVSRLWIFTFFFFPCARECSQVICSECNAVWLHVGWNGCLWINCIRKMTLLYSTQQVSPFFDLM